MYQLNEKVRIIIMSNISAEFEVAQMIKYNPKTYSIDLSHGDMTMIPNNLRKLVNLRIIHLSGNRLVNIPDWFADLENLEQVYLDNNQLRTLPESIVKLDNLLIFSIYNNDFDSVPSTVVDFLLGIRQ